MWYNVREMEQEIPVLLCCCLLALGVCGAERAVSDEAVARDWMRQESVPTLHKPYASGSGASGLMECLELTHCGRELSADEKETVALWLDLAVPFCGSYLEGRLWTKEEELRYAHYQDKRLLYAREELEMARRRKGKDR